MVVDGKGRFHRFILSRMHHNNDDDKAMCFLSSSEGGRLARNKFKKRGKASRASFWFRLSFIRLGATVGQVGYTAQEEEHDKLQV